MPQPNGEDTGVRCRVADAGSETNGRDEVGVAGDEHGVELG